MRSHNSLKVLYANARSIQNKFSDLDEIVFIENYDIIGITESWLNKEDRDFLAEYSLPGYTMSEKSRINKNGGGVLFFIRESLNPVLMSKPQIVNISISYVLLKNNQGTQITLALFNIQYRPPAQSVETDQEIYKQISEICDIQNTVILGNFKLSVTK